MAAVECQVNKRKRKSENGEKSTKKKKKETTNETKHENKYKSLMELAKLVRKGRLAVPKSLDAYVEDSVILIDQLFTILASQDVEGMLPDVLKGLKMRHIKELCLIECKKIASDELKSIISDKADERMDSISVSDISEEETMSVNHTDDTTITTSKASIDQRTPPPAGNDKPVIVILHKSPTKSHDSPVKSHDSPVKSHECLVKSHDSAMQTQPEKMELISVGLDSDDDIQLTVDSNVTLDNNHTEHGGIREHQKLVELQLRNRLLEKQMKKIQDVSGTSNKETSSHNEDISSDNNVMEIKLRERALQSLLLKKKNFS